MTPSDFGAGLFPDDSPREDAPEPKEAQEPSEDSPRKKGRRRRPTARAKDEPEAGVEDLESGGGTAIDAPEGTEAPDDTEAPAAMEEAGERTRRRRKRRRGRDRDEGTDARTDGGHGDEVEGDEAEDEAVAAVRMDPGLDPVELDPVEMDPEVDPEVDDDELEAEDPAFAIDWDQPRGEERREERVERGAERTAAPPREERERDRNRDRHRDSDRDRGRDRGRDRDHGRDRDRSRDRDRDRDRDEPREEAREEIRGREEGGREPDDSRRRRRRRGRRDRDDEGREHRDREPREPREARDTREPRDPRGQPLPKRHTSTQRLGVLVDLDSLETAAADEFDGHLSPIGLLEELSHGRQTPRAIVYYGRDQRGRNEALRGAGFDTLVALEDRTRRVVQIAMDAASIVRRVDAVVLATADASLVPVADFLRAQGLRVEIATFPAAAREFADCERRGASLVQLGDDAIFVP